MPGVFFGVHRRLPREESRDKSAILSSQEQMVVSMLSATWFVQSVCCPGIDSPRISQHLNT